MSKQKAKAITCLKPSGGGLHLGHYIGNIQPLIKHQDEYECYFIFADLQVLNSENGAHIDDNILLMLKQLIALGVDPCKVHFYRESSLKKDKFQEFIFLSDYVTNSRINRMPVFKAQKNPPKMSMYVFPILQIMDFYLTEASIAFSNVDNKAAIELANEVFNKINKEYRRNLSHIELIHGTVEMLVGFDGQKMSKAKNNCIYFTDSFEQLSKKINKMYTDPNHIKVNDPGDISNNVVFKYLKAFVSEDEYKHISTQYINGNLGDKQSKQILIDILWFLMARCQQTYNEVKDDIIEYVK